MKKYQVGVRPMRDQSDVEFRRTRRPRTRNFRNEERAYEYFRALEELAKSSCFIAFIETREK